MNINTGKSELKILIDTIPSNKEATVINKKDLIYKHPITLDIINPIKDNNISILSEPSIQILIEGTVMYEFKTRTIFQFISPFSQEGTIKLIAKLIQTDISDFYKELGKKESTLFSDTDYHFPSNDRLIEKIRMLYLANWSN